MNETADKNDSPQRRSLAAKFLRPSWDERKRMLRIEARVFVIASYLLLAFAYLWPPAYERQSPIYVTVAWAAFMIRIFVFHLGLVLLIIAAIALYARRWRLTASVVPLLVITIGPTCRDFLPKAKPTIQGEQVIPDGNVLAGTLPPGKTRLVQAWIEIHQEDLIADWRLTVNGEEPFRITPLR